LARFDGARFSVLDRTNTPLPNNRVQALAETSDGSLWIGTENGLTRYQAHEFTNYSTHDGLPSDNIRALWADPSGPLWITTSQGVRKWGGKRFERDSSTEAAAGPSLRQVLPTPSGRVWVASDSGITDRSSGSGASFMGDRWIRGKTVRAMVEDSHGELWIGTTAGLFRLARHQTQPYVGGSQVIHQEVTALLEDRDHNVWVGTLGEGLMRINQGGTEHYSVADGLSGIEITCLYQDAAGNLWVGTFGGGLEVFRDTMFTTYGQREGVSQNVVWTVREGRDSSIWVGTQSGGLNRIKNGHVSVYSTRSGFSDDTVGSLFEARDGTLWLGKDSGLSRFKEGVVLGAPAATSMLHEQVHTIYEDGSGTMWIGTRTQGLVQLRGDRYTAFGIREGLPNNNVQSFTPSKNGGFWIGTLAGLSYFKNGRLTSYTTKDGLSADQVIALYEDPDGTLWIGTDGLSRLKNGRITSYGRQQGLGQTPLAIVEDDDGYLWLSTNKGIVRVSKKQLNDFADGKRSQLASVVFGSEDGMRSAECNGGSSPAAWKDHNGNLWFPTVAGALKIDPRRLMDRLPLQLHIEDVRADKKQLVPTESFVLPPGGHELEFHYSAPYFAGATRLRYEYKLEGFDKDWVDAGARTVAYYTNVPPGKYRFRVAVTVAGANPNRHEDSVPLYLTPHFWQTRIFYAALGIAIAGLMFLAWVWTNRVMIARQNELERLVEARTRELETEKAELLEAKTALAEQATHDSLTGLMNRAAILHVLETEMRKAEREGTSFAVVLADIDHFKLVNDTYGHLVGDDVLREFAQRLSVHLRSYDQAGRFGGEEFLIIMPGFSHQHRSRIEEFQRDLSCQQFPTGEVDLQITCSVGVAFWHLEVRSAESLLILADRALYRAKANGRNRVEVTEDLLQS
jgi:diguanylate cyclase (GGDEF)-like protein